MPIDDDVELDTEKESPPKKKGSKLKLITWVVAGVLLLGGTTAGVYFSGIIPAFSAHAEGEEDVASADNSDGKDAAKKGDKTKGKGKKNGKKKEEPKVTLYLPLDPAFVVNFQEQGQLRFLQVTMEVMARDQEVLDAVKTHLPVIRNNLTLMLSSQSLENLASREGKEKVRAETLTEIQKILKEQTGKPGVEAVYFTSFVMQ